MGRAIGAVTAAFLALAAGCGGEDGGPAAVELDAFCDEWVRAVCSGAERCSCAAAVPDSAGRCPEVAAPACPLAEGTSTRTAVDDGSLAYDAQAAGRYLAALGGVRCEAFAFCAAPGPCIGLESEGGTCGGSSGCAEGLACVDGACRTPSRVGATCAENAECESGRCADGACAEKAVDGEPCGEDSECASGRCDFTRGSCRPPEPLEGLCMEHEDCESGYCDRDLELGAGNCRVRRTDGETCDEDPQCLGGACIDGICAAAICDLIG